MSLTPDTRVSYGTGPPPLLFADGRADSARLAGGSVDVEARRDRERPGEPPG